MNALVPFGVLDLIRQSPRAEAFWVDVTPDLARLLLDGMRGNRPVRESAVRRYREEIRSGKWKATGQGLILDKAGSMIDGQHRCSAVVAEQTPARFLVVLGVDPDVWTSLDVGAKRTASDFIGDRTSSYTAVAAALNWVWCEVHRGPDESWFTRRISMPAGEAPAFLALHPGLTQLVSEYNVTKAKEACLPPSLLLYCSYRMFRYDQIRASAFLEGLISGVGLSEGSPVLAIRSRLIANKGTKAKLPPTEILALMIKAWIKFVDGTTTKTNLRWRREGDQIETCPIWPGGLLPRLGEM